MTGTSPEKPLDPGTLIQDRYRIERHLGGGGFGAVYEATHLAIDARVAIKLLYAYDDTQRRERFVQEARAAARINHPGVITIHDCGVTRDDRPFIVMELLKGLDLSQSLHRHGPMDPRRAIPLFCHCLDALGEAHKLGIVHKDLKPSNLFLTHPGTRIESLKILDFGIARLLDSQLTQSGQTIGTAQYLAPEYIEHQRVSPALDVYQMGLVLIEMLTGLPAVRATSWWGAVSAHLRRELTIPDPLRLSRLGPIVSQALQRDPHERFQDASAMRDALETLTPDDLAAIAQASAHRPDRIVIDPLQVLQYEAPGPHAPDLTQALPPAPEGFVLVESGSFQMGSPTDEPGRVHDEHPHQAALTRAFIIQQVLVTQGQWAELMGHNPAFYKGPERPVEQVSWYDALAFCNALSAKASLRPCYTFEDPRGTPGVDFTCRSVRSMGLDGEGYRLPTEAEWEKAARAGTTTAFYSGPCRDTVEDPALTPIAWYKVNAGGRTRAVGCKTPNNLEIFDMLGNVAEWVYDAYAPYREGPAVDPIVDHGDPGARRVFRGGSWHCLARDCRVARRNAAPASTTNRTIGLRPVRTWRGTDHTHEGLSR